MKSAPQKILGINTPFELIEYSGFVESDFRSSTSFLDYDAVVINTSFLATEYDADFPKTYKGKRMITKDDSHRIVDDFIRTKTQIIELLKQGKNVFILMTKNENCFIYTGKTSYSGTGKNARGTDYVAEFDTFSFLPIDINPTMVSGETFNIVCQPPYSVFFQKIKEMIYYDAYFEAPKKSALLTIPNSDKVISSIFEYEKGKIIVLPYLYDEDWFEDEKDWKKCGKIFLDALFELNHILLSNTESYTLPLWSENIKILDEEEIENKIEQERKKIRLLESKMQTHESLLKKVQQKKILITASGTPLEEAVQEILKEIGFSLYEVEKGRSDIIGQYESTDIVAEIKGVSKSAAEKHAAQLEKWVAQFIEEKERLPKAILIVNGFCDTPLAERTEAVFPNQMLKYCEARGHALITTTQLLCLYIEIKNNPSCAKERITELLSCVGTYPRYLDFENYLKLISNENQ